MQKRWLVKELHKEDEEKQLAASMNINNVLAKLLIQRGITSKEKADSFFKPDFKDLHDPLLMHDMEKAVNRIGEAVKNNEKILVYGDYDVDGTAAVALVYSFLKELNIDTEFYIPDRYKEGYGISDAGVDYAAKNNYKLVIALDCGIKAVDQISKAKEEGIDFIICDHHRPGNKLPEAYAILDPKKGECTYPFKELSGCGIGYKLVQAYIKLNESVKIDIEKYLDLVVLSIASDIVPINGENRILAFHGLKKINTTPRPGIEALFIYSKILRRHEKVIKNESGYIFNREISINDLVFLVGPRLNAAGRIDNGKNAVELLLSDNLQDAKSKGVLINISNTERQNLDKETTINASNMVEINQESKNKKTIVLFNENWHKGVVGIVASRLTEKYYKPTVILTKSNGLYTGSARSIKDFDLYEAIEHCSDVLEHFGGHKYAAGLSMKPENLEKFEEKFEKFASAKITVDMQQPVIDIDSKLDLRNVNQDFINILKKFAPFGPENPSPIFASDNVIDKGTAKIVGEKHLKLKISLKEHEKISFDAIAFQLKDYLDDIAKGCLFDICYHLEENEWEGNVSIQLNIKDIGKNGDKYY